MTDRSDPKPWYKTGEIFDGQYEENQFVPLKENSEKRGHKDWTHNIPYDVARLYNTRVYVRNKSRRGNNGQKQKEG